MVEIGELAHESLRAIIREHGYGDVLKTIAMECKNEAESFLDQEDPADARVLMDFANKLLEVASQAEDLPVCEGSFF